MNDVAAQVLLFIVGAIAALDAAITVFTFPRVLKLNSMIPQKLDDALNEIENVMSFFSEGEVNTSEAKRRLRIAEEKGVGWPISLPPLMDDIEKRANTF